MIGWSSRTVFVALSVVALLFVSSSVSQASLVAHWPFESSGADSSGNGNNLSESGAPVSYVSAVNGNGVLLNGSDNSSLELADAQINGTFPSASSGTAGNFSIAVWARVDDLPNRNVIVAKQTSPQRGLLWTIENGKVLYECWPDGATSGVTLTSNATLTTGLFYHLALTYDDITDTARLYIDGDLDIEVTSFGGPPRANSQVFYVGQYHWSPSYQRYFIGTLDDLRGYDHALTENDVAVLAVQVNDPPTIETNTHVFVNWPGNSVSLSATATDDGLPAIPGSLTYTWEMVSGPGSVVFQPSANVSDPMVTLPDIGTYRLRLLVDDGELTTSKTVGIFVYQDVKPPMAHWPTNIHNGSHITETALGFDGILTSPSEGSHWFRFIGSGPGTVAGQLEISCARDAQRHIIVPDFEGITGSGSRSVALWFSLDNFSVRTSRFGFYHRPEYTLFEWGDDLAGKQRFTIAIKRISGEHYIQISNGDASITSLDTIPNLNCIHLAVSLDDDGSMTLDEAAIYLNGVPAAFSVSSGDLTVDTGTGPFYIAGNVDDADDSYCGYLSDIRLYAHALNQQEVLFAMNGNERPNVSILTEPDTILEWPSDTLPLTAAASDDGWPPNPGQLSLEWTMIQGPGQVQFQSDPYTLEPTAVFPQPGYYELQLSAGDGELTSSDHIGVVVYESFGLAHWPLDEVTGLVANEAGGRFDGDLINFTGDDSQWIDGALQLDGVDDHVRVPGLNGVVGKRARTVMAWIKAEQPHNGTILSWGELTTSSQWTFRVQNSRPGTTPGSLQAGVWGGRVIGTQNICDGQWHHIAATLDPADPNSPLPSDITLYVDGNVESLAEVTDVAINTSGANEVHFGARADGANFFEGLLDDVRIYEGALSQLEIKLSAGLSNSAPQVHAGEVQTVFFSDSPVSLNSQFTDDGLPLVPGVVGLLWEKVSGPGDVTFEPNAFVANPLAYFSAAGNYVLQVAADDGELIGQDSVTVSLVDVGSGLLVPNVYPTIQAAIDAADPNDTIALQPGTYSRSGNQGVIIDNKPLLTICSADPINPAATVIDILADMDDPNRAFTITNSNVTIKGLTIRNGLADGGGAIKVIGGSLTVDRCRLYQNATLPGNAGEFFGGTSYSDGADGYPGGAVASFNATVSLLDCQLDNNQTGLGGIGPLQSGSEDFFRSFYNAGQGGAGGAIYASQSVLSLTGCRLESNQSGDGGTGWQSGRGGDGGAVYSTGGSLTIQGQCMLLFNSAGNGGLFTAPPGDWSSIWYGGPGGRGGAIYAIQCQVSLNDSTVTDNLAGNGDEADQDGGDGGDGGAIATIQGSLNIQTCSIDRNKAGRAAPYGTSGGSNSQSEGGDGGALFCDQTALMILDTTFAANSTGRTAGSAFTGAGGAIYCTNAPANVEILGSSFSGNFTERGAGGGGQYDLGGPGGDGGAIYCTGADLTLSHCLFKYNATGEGGSIEFELSHRGGHGGAIYAEVITALSCHFHANRTGNGGTDVDDNGAPASGGDGAGIYGHHVTISNCLFTENRPGDGGDRSEQSSICGSEPGNGSAVYASTAIIKNSTLANNLAGKQGSFEICTDPILVTDYTVQATTSLEVVNSIFWNNESDQPFADCSNVTYSNVENGVCNTGTGNISIDPLFVRGIAGDHYLSQIAAGQGIDSPCVDAGSDTAVNLGLDQLTTRTDQIGDAGIVDMGYHYPPQFHSLDLNQDSLVNWVDFALALAAGRTDYFQFFTELSQDWIYPSVP